jgi:predicted metal-dependent HD superfamily phosphohydrolase
MMGSKYLANLARGLGLQPNVESYLDQQLASPHRHYHTIHHLGLMENYLHRRLFVEGDYSDEQFARRHWRNWLLAILFHDIVYDPTASDNEELSALEMKLRIGNMKRVNIDLIERMILATKGHEFKTGWPLSDQDRAVNQFLAADLSILWSPLPTYQWYARGVRKEYAHVPNELYRKGRADVLEKLVNGLSEHLQVRDLPALTANVAWEKDMLESGKLDV